MAISNRGSRPRTVIVEPELPPGWKVLFREEPFTLAASATEVHFVTILIPARARAGGWTCSFLAKDQGPPGEHASVQKTIQVLPDAGLDLKFLLGPPFVLSGKEYEAAFLLTNTGNVGVRAILQVETSGSLPFAIRGIGQEGTLAAGESRQFSVVVRTRESFGRLDRHSLQVRVRIRSDESVLVRSFTSFEVVPRSVDPRSIHHLLPVVSETAARSDDGTLEFQERLRGSGTIDPAGNQKIEFDVQKHHKPDYQNWYDPWDRYSFQYQTRQGSLSLGDLCYDLSPLVADHEYGRGVQGTLNLLPWRVKTLYFQNIGNERDPGNWGGSVDFTVPGSWGWEEPFYRIGVNALSPLRDSELLGVYQQYRPLPKTLLALDAAVDRRVTGSIFPAIDARTEGSFGPLEWTGHILRKTKDFDGAPGDTGVAQSSARLQILGPALALKGGFFLANNNLLDDPGLESTSRVREFTLGTEVDFGNGRPRTGLEWENWTRRTGAPGDSYDTRENALRLFVRESLSPTVLNLGSRVGFVQEETGGGTFWSQEHSASVETWPWVFLRTELSLRYVEARDREQKSSRWVGGVLGTSIGRGDLRFEVSLQKSYLFDQDKTTEEQLGAGATVTCTFPWRHTLVVEDHHAMRSSDQGPSYSGSVILTYRVPFEFPISRLPDSSVVTGRVFDEASRRPLSGVVLRTDDQGAVTDADGRFTFYLSTSGTKTIRIENSTVDSRLISVRPTPMEVVAPPGRTARYDIAMTKAGTVTGTVTQYDLPDTGSFVPSTPIPGAGDGPVPLRRGGMGNLVVELSSGTEHWQSVTNASGDFGFTRLKPGSYTLRIVGPVPADYGVEANPQTFELKPGEGKAVDFQVVEHRRTVRIQNTDVPLVIEKR